MFKRLAFNARYLIDVVIFLWSLSIVYYTLEEPVATATNVSYNYPAKFDPSNTIEAKENEAYAMSITTEKNEAYKPSR